MNMSRCNVADPQLLLIVIVSNDFDGARSAYISRVSILHCAHAFFAHMLKVNQDF